MITNKKKSQAGKPKQHFGTKDEKRREKKEKLAKELNMKLEAQRQAALQNQQMQQQQFGYQDPIQMGEELPQLLEMIEQTAISSNTLDRKNKKQKQIEQIGQLQQLYQDPSFETNPRGILNAVSYELQQKTMRNIQAQKK